MWTETGKTVFGTSVLTDETGQTVAHPNPAPGFSVLTETGEHVEAYYFPYLQYAIPEAAFASNIADSQPAVAVEITLVPLDNDHDTVTTTKPLGVG